MHAWPVQRSIANPSSVVGVSVHACQLEDRYDISREGFKCQRHLKQAKAELPWVPEGTSQCVLEDFQRNLAVFTSEN